MTDWPKRWLPLAASLLGHLALIAAVAGAGHRAGPAAAPEAAVIPVRRVLATAPAPLPPLRLQAPGAEQPTPEAPGAAAVALDTADPRYRPYLAGVRRRIWERWEAPAPSRGRPARGALVVEFTLARSGRVEAAGVSAPSGVPAFDRAALDAVARAGPFPPLPAAIAGEALRVRARFVYD